MAKFWCDFRFLLFVAALVFIYIQVPLSFNLNLFVSFRFVSRNITSSFRFVSFRFLQMRLFATQSQYADRLAVAVCNSTLHFHSIFALLCFALHNQSSKSVLLFHRLKLKITVQLKYDHSLIRLACNKDAFSTYNKKGTVESKNVAKSSLLFKILKVCYHLCTLSSIFFLSVQQQVELIHK